MEVLPGGQLSKDAVHPYTRALMGSVFDINMDFSKPIENLEGEAPSPLELPEGCPFQVDVPNVWRFAKRSSANGQPYTGSSGRLSSVYKKYAEINKTGEK